MATYNSHETQRMLDVHGAPLAPFWRRAAAFVLDILIMSLLFAVVVGSLMLLLIQLGWVQPSNKFTFALNINPHSVGWVNWYSVAWVVIYFSLATYFGNGRTPGKALLGIRVLSLTHARISLWHSLERALGYGASMLEFGFGFIQYFIHPNRRTVHDRIAETIVVREPRRKRIRSKARKSPAADKENRE
jgi:uncharacterized RDD family membrane protein YckC